MSVPYLIDLELTEFFQTFIFSVEAYDDHMKDHFENEWLCHLCGRKLKTKRNLINHYFVHTGSYNHDIIVELVHFNNNF